MIHFKKKIVLFTTLMFALFLAACGSSSDGNGNGNDIKYRDITLTPTTSSLKVGETVSLTATLSVGTGTVSYFSENQAVATVSTGGVVTAKGAGATTISAFVRPTNEYITRGAGLLRVTVTSVTRSLTLTPSTTQSLMVGATRSLSAALSAGTGTVTYVSSNPAVARVSTQGGVVTAVKAGSARIIASVVASGIYASASAQIQANISSAFSRSEYRVAVGESTSAVAQGATGYAAQSATIATVDSSSGLVTGVARGVIGITATYASGVTESVSVVVNNRPTGNTDYASFVNGYQPTTKTGVFAETLNGFSVFAFQGNGITANFSVNDAAGIAQRQAVGRQFADTTTRTDGYAGISIQASTDGSVVFDYSSATHLVIQMGNGRSKGGQFSSTAGDTYSTFTVRVLGFSGVAQRQCQVNVGIPDNSRPPADSTLANPYGLQTYILPFSGMACSEGKAGSVLPGVREVVVLVEEGNNPAAAASTNTQTLITVGNIGFRGITSTAPKAAANQLFSSGYTQNDSLGRFAGTNQNAGVYQFGDGGNVGYSGFQVNQTDAINQRQAVGRQYRIQSGLAANKAFGITVQAPNIGRVLISTSHSMSIQTGNGVGNTVSHTTYTIRITGGIQHPTNYSWEHDCQVDLDVSNSRPIATNSNAHPYGLATYSIPVSSFTQCSSGSLSGIIANGVSEVIVSVVGGKNPTADAAADVHTLISAGWISFNR